MNRSTILLLAVFAVGGAGGWFAAQSRVSPVHGQTNPATPEPTKPTGPEAAIRAITADYEKAFNAGDAKGAAALWTTDGEYVGADGVEIRGRDDIEKSLAELFKASPKISVKVTVDSVRPMGRGLAMVQGHALVTKPGETQPEETRYRSLHVLEDGKWLAASVSEWEIDPATDVSVKNLEWLVGEWTSKGDGGDMTITYSWDDDKVFLIGKYSMVKDGKTISKGTQYFGKNPHGGLRSWMFDSTGTTSDAIWTRDGDRWLSEAHGILPEGNEVTSLNILVPLGPDAFTWQTAEREIDGASVPGLPPVRINRVKK